MANFFYPRTIDVAGNLSGSGIAEDPAGLKPDINISTLTSSVGNISTLTSSVGNISTLTSSVGNISTLTSSYANIYSITGSYINNFQTVSDILAATQRFQTPVLTASNSILSSATASILHIDTLVNCTNGSISTVTINTASIQTLTSSVGSISTVTINTASIQTLTSSVGVSASYFYGDGNKLTNINPGNINLSAYAPLAGTNTWTGVRNNFQGQVTGSKVFIGTSPKSLINENEIFQIAKADQAFMSIGATAGTNDHRVIFGVAPNASSPFIGTHSNHSFVLRTNNNERVWIDASGRVGIGDSTPETTLKVQGTGKFTNEVYIGVNKGEGDNSIIVDNGNIQLNDSSKGIDLNDQNSPIITRRYDPFTSGTKTGVGRWGLFMEPYELIQGIPNNVTATWRVSAYDEDGTKTNCFSVANDRKSYAHGLFVAESGISLGSNSINIAAGGGILFDNGTTSDTTSQLLDDYEEGTWTANLVGWTNAMATWVASTYTKIGRLVVVRVTITATAGNTTFDFDQNSTITGLPFSSSRYTAATACCENGGNSPSALSCYVDSNIIRINTDSSALTWLYITACYTV